MNESSLSPAAHFQRACLGNPDLGQLQLTPARDMVARWHRLAQGLGGLPCWESLMAELWTAGYLPHLFRLALAPAHPLGESFESFLDSEGIKEAVYAAAIKRLIALQSGTALTPRQELTLPVAPNP